MAELLEGTDRHLRRGAERPRQLVRRERVPERGQPLLDVQDLGTPVARMEHAHHASLRPAECRRKRAARYRCGARSRTIASFGLAPITRATSCPPLDRMSDGIDMTP